MGFERGDVVWAPDLFKQALGSEFGGPNPRPWLVVNTSEHPYSDEEYVALSLTTTQRPEAVHVDEGDWTTGGSPRDSYVVPWNPATIKHAWTGDGRQGRIQESVVEEAVDALKSYL